MLVVVALTLSWFVASSLLFSGEKSDRNFYSMIAATMVWSIIARFLRKTKHTHNPVDDAIGNAEALLQMKDMGLKISFA